MVAVLNPLPQLPSFGEPFDDLRFSENRSWIPRVHTFKIRVYPPAILPMLAVYGEVDNRGVNSG
jgi:hypothetical protein